MRRLVRTVRSHRSTGRAAVLVSYPSAARPLLVAVVGLLSLLLILAVLAPPAYGQDAGLTPEQEKLVADMEKKLIAPCCWTQTVAVHDSQAAESVKMQLRSLAAGGAGEEEMTDYMVEQYGEKILATPRVGGFNSLAYALPVLALLVGAGGLILVMRRWRRGRSEGAEVSLPLRGDEESSDLRRRMDEELSGFDP